MKIKVELKYEDNFDILHLFVDDNIVADNIVLNEFNSFNVKNGITTIQDLLNEVLLFLEDQLYLNGKDTTKELNENMRSKCQYYKSIQSNEVYELNITEKFTIDKYNRILELSRM